MPEPSQNRSSRSAPRDTRWSPRSLAWCRRARCEAHPARRRPPRAADRASSASARARGLTSRPCFRRRSRHEHQERYKRWQRDRRVRPVIDRGHRKLPNRGAQASGRGSARPPGSLPPSQPCLPRSNGAWSAFRSRHLWHPGSDRFLTLAAAQLLTNDALSSRSPNASSARSASTGGQARSGWSGAPFTGA